jgi:4-amino-4-deoxy-L-arabinose transferase-like glycosyltransferase
LTDDVSAHALPRPTQVAPGVASGVTPSVALERRFDPVALLVVLAGAVLLFHAAWVVGPTYDEHFYIVAGMSYLADWDFALNREHPPLLKFLAGLLPTLLGPVDLPSGHSERFNLPGSFFYQTAAEHWHTLLVLGRVPFCLVTLATGVLLYSAARRWFGRTAGRVALVAWLGNPNVLAHGPLAALDMGCAAAMAGALVTFVAALRRPTAARRLATGVALGLACATKFTALVLWPIVAVASLAAVWSRRSRAPLVTLLWSVPVALTVFSACYGFEARSIDSVRRELAYQSSAPSVDLGAAATTDALVAGAGDAAVAGLERALARMRKAPSSEAAVNVWLEELATAAAANTVDGAVVEARTRALTTLAAAPGRVRKSAFRVVLDLERVAPDVRVPLLAALSRAEVREGDDALAAWRAWFESQTTANWDVTILAHPLLSRVVRGLFGEHRPVPVLTALAGLDQQLEHARIGHASYYRGRTLGPVEFAAGERVPLYYVDVLFHKHPLAFTLLVALGAAFAFVRTERWGRLEALAFMGSALFLLVLFSSGTSLMGVRYVLPLLPIFALLAGRAAQRLPRTAVLLVVVAVGESLWIQPHQLMYFNVAAGGPSGGTYITVNGDDWGQDAAGLGRWAAENRDAVREAGGLFHDPYLEADPAAFGLGGSPPYAMGQRGYVAVSIAERRRYPARYEWLADAPVVATIGYTITIFDTRRLVPQSGGGE